MNITRTAEERAAMKASIAERTRQLQQGLAAPPARVAAERPGTGECTASGPRGGTGRCSASRTGNCRSSQGTGRRRPAAARHAEVLAALR